MNWDMIEGNWKQYKGQALQKWGELTEDDLDSVSGSREVLEGKIQEKYGKTKEEARQEIDEFIAGL